MSQLETDLKAWMHEHAARVHASPQLLAADYGPRAPRLRSTVRIGGGLATALATALVVVLSLTGGASNAFAGWTPQPTTPTPAQRAAAEAYCARNVPVSNLPLKLTDGRGPFTILVYSNGTSNSFCTVGPTIRNASGWMSSPPVRPHARSMFLWTDHTSTARGELYGTMIAQVGRGVSALKVRLDDGAVVTATLEHGWAAAWWPGDHHVASARLKTRTGTRTQTFRKYPCDVHDCGGYGPNSR